MDNFKNDAIFSSSFRAGRRTYFFDMKKTRSDDFFLTITESKKHTDIDSGDVKFEKHRIFLYNEDFEKFVNTLNEILNKTKESTE